MVLGLEVVELSIPQSPRAMRCSLRGENLRLEAVLKLSGWRLSVFFCSMTLWKGLGWGHILELAAFLLTLSSSRPGPGADGCAFLYRVMDGEVRSPLRLVFFPYIWSKLGRGL